MKPIASPGDLEQNTLYLGRVSMPTRHGDFTVHYFRDLAHDRVALAIACGDMHGSAPLLLRVHSSCLTSECLSGQDCDCAEQLDGALAMMAGEGEGVVFYLMQEGRGAGLTAKARDRMIVQASENRKTTFDAYAEMGLPPDLRRYGVLAPMSRLLGLRAPLRLLTNNPDKAAAVSKAFAAEGITVWRMERIGGTTSPFNRDYLAAKHDSGHVLARPARLQSARPPVDVPVVEPFVLAGAGHRVLTASYFLPIALPSTSASEREIDWFRLSVIFDGRLAKESIVIAHHESQLGDWHGHGDHVNYDGHVDHGDHGDHVVDESMAAVSAVEANVSGAGPRTNEITMSLLDRLPLRAAPGRRALRKALLGIRRAGRGSVAVSFDDRECACAGIGPSSDSASSPKAEVKNRKRAGHRVEY